MNKITAFLTCLCVALMIALGVTQHQLNEAQTENETMRQQIREIRVQVDEIWAEYMGLVKWIQQHGGA